MKVYAFIKIVHHPQEPDGPGVHYGDIVSFHRMETKRSAKELKYFLPVQVDINIPCGEKYDREMKGKCGECRFNDPTLCDVQKFARASWSAGDIINPPEVVHRCRYSMPIKTLIPSDKLQLAEKSDKTETDRQTIMDYVSKNTISITAITDKVK